MRTDTAASHGLTAAQQRIVEWGDGPLVVIAGAGTGKTRVMVERVRHLLETRGDVAIAPDGTLQASYPSPDVTSQAPFAGPLLPDRGRARVAGRRPRVAPAILHGR